MAKFACARGWLLLETVLALGVLVAMLTGMAISIAAFSKPLRHLIETESRFITAQNRAERLRAGDVDPTMRAIPLSDGLIRYEIDIRPGLHLDYIDAAP